MINSYRKDLSFLKERTVDESGEGCGGGYGIDNTVYIDENLPIEQQPLVIIHEVLNILLYDRVSHSQIDRIGIEIIDNLQQLGYQIKYQP